MKRLLIAGVAALLLATGTAHAADDEKIDRDFGTTYECRAGTDFDDVSIKHEHILSSESRTTITIESLTGGHRYKNGKTERYPTIRYNVETGKLTLNGKPCRKSK
jgi:hypothetical protein